jgi:hypothetical protein
LTFGYACENELRDALAAALQEGTQEFNRVDIAIEFFHGSGRTDVIAHSGGDLIAFETKLRNWRSAMQQAYRNCSFAHYSYVVLPAAAVDKADIGEFLKRNIGLCSVERGQLTITIAAPKQRPLKPWITASAVALCAKTTYGPPRLARS